MKKTFAMMLLVSTIVAGATAWGVSALFKNNNDNTYAQPNKNKADGYFTFANSSTQGILPDLTQAAEKGVAAVVNIENIRKVTYQQQQGNDLFEFFFGPQGRQNPQNPQNQQQEPQTREQRSGGSGVILSPDGYIVTNNHVIDGADQLKVTLHDGQVHVAKLIGTDPSTDIALLKIEATDLPVLSFGNSEELRLGEWVLAVGNPMGLTSTVTAGIVSAQGRSLGMLPTEMGIESFIQTDAVVNPGNSGGALMTVDGNLVGINTILKSNTGTYIGYSFAVPSSIVRKVVGDLREYGVVQRAVLGIRYSELSPEWLEKFGEELNVTDKEGLYVGEVIADGAAAEAGLKKGDVIIAINGNQTRTSAQMQEMLAKLRPNDKITITAKRASAVKQFEVTLRNRAGKAELMSRDDVDVQKLLGATFQPINDAAKKKLDIKNGLQVIQLTPNGLLAKSRVQQGFIITAINGITINSTDDLNRITQKVESIDGVYPDGKNVSYVVVN